MIEKPNASPNNFGSIEDLLFGSAQPGYRARHTDDARVLRELKGSLRPIVDRELLSDLEYLDQNAIRTIYSIAHRANERDPELAKYLWEQRGYEYKYITQIGETELAVADFTAPTVTQLALISQDASREMEAGRKVLIHCGAGLGRTGTALAAVHMALSKDYNVDNCISYVREKYNEQAVEGAYQKLALRNFAKKLQTDEVNLELASGNPELIKNAFVKCLEVDMEDKASEILRGIEIDVNSVLQGASLKAKDNGLNLAITTGNIALAEHAIAVGANVNGLDKQGVSLFSKALVLDDQQLIAAFYSNPNFDVNETDINGKSNFDYAVTQEDKELIKQLVIRGANPEGLLSKEELTRCFASAVRLGNFDGIKNLLQAEYSLYDTPIDGKSVIDYATNKEDLALYIALLSVKPDFDDGDRELGRQIIEDNLVKNPDLFKSLISQGVDLRTFGVEYGSPSGDGKGVAKTEVIESWLKEAIQYNNTRYIKNISDYEPSVKYLTNIGVSYLTSAILSSQGRNYLPIKMAEYGFFGHAGMEMVDANKDLDLAILLQEPAYVGKYLRTAESNINDSFIKAIQSENTDIFKLFLKSGKVNINQTSSDGHYIPLIEAVKIIKQNYDILSLILDEIELNIAVKDPASNKTPLMIAVENVAPAVMRKLVSKGSEVDEVTAASSALIIAARDDHPAMARLLLDELGANPNIRSAINKTALMSTHNEEIMHMLIIKGAEFNANDANDMIKNKSEDRVYKLLKLFALNRSSEESKDIIDGVLQNSKRLTLKDQLYSAVNHSHNKSELFGYIKKKTQDINSKKVNYSLLPPPPAKLLQNKKTQLPKKINHTDAFSNHNPFGEDPFDFLPPAAIENGGKVKAKTNKKVTDGVFPSDPFGDLPNPKESHREKIQSEKKLAAQNDPLDREI
jgi:ankyrin repeat protein